MSAKALLFTLTCLLNVETFAQANIEGDARAKQPEIYRQMPEALFLPRPHSLEFVHLENGEAVAQDALMQQYLDLATIALIKSFGFQYLMLRKADIANISTPEGDVLAFKVFIDVRYVKTQIIDEATVSGEFDVQLKNGKLVFLQQVGDFAASQGGERFVQFVRRNVATDLYPLFQSVVAQTLSKVLEKPGAADLIQTLAAPAIPKP